MHRPSFCWTNFLWGRILLQWRSRLLLVVELDADVVEGVHRPGGVVVVGVEGLHEVGHKGGEPPLLYTLADLQTGALRYSYTSSKHEFTFSYRHYKSN